MYGLEERPMIIGIDFDDTITRAPELWLQIISLLRANGHQVHVVTYRDPEWTPEDLEFLKGKVDSMNFTSLTAKDEFCRSKGLYIDIWIDDTPMAINHDLINGTFKRPDKPGLILKSPSGRMPDGSWKEKS